MQHFLRAVPHFVECLRANALILRVVAVRTQFNGATSRATRSACEVGTKSLAAAKFASVL